jgi:hypothetical protein
MGLDVWTTFAASDFATRIIVPVVTSVATTIVTIGFKNRRERDTALSGDLIERLKSIKDESQNITELVALHLQGKGEGSMKDSQSTVHRKLKSLEAQIEELEPMLEPMDFTRLKNEYLEWWKIQTDSPFPVLKKASAVKAHDAALNVRHDAEIALRYAILDLEIEFLAERRRVKLRKRRLPSGNSRNGGSSK